MEVNKNLQRLEQLVEKMLSRIQNLEQEKQQQAIQIAFLTQEIEQKKQLLSELKWKQAIETVSVSSIDTETKEILLEKIEMLLQEIEDCLSTEQFHSE